jgi:hypothetical protein
MVEWAARDKHPSLFQTFEITAVKCFLTLGPRVNLIKLFWRKFTYTFCKLELFVSVNIFLWLQKRSRLLKDRVNIPEKVL